MGNIEGVKAGLNLGIGRAVVPKHLIVQNRNLRILNPGTVLRVPVVLHYYEQPYYTDLHKKVVKQLAVRCRRLLEEPKTSD